MNLTPAGQVQRPGTKIARLLDLKPGDGLLVPYAEMRSWRVTCTRAHEWYGVRFSTRREGDNMLIYRVA